VGSEELGSNLEKQMRSAKPIMIMKAPFLQVTKGNDPKSHIPKAHLTADNQQAAV
jgi:hypothetical protein